MSEENQVLMKVMHINAYFVSELPEHANFKTDLVPTDCADISLRLLVTLIRHMSCEKNQIVEPLLRSSVI